MANYTMHHAVIGSDTYEIVDEQARDGKSSAIYCTTSGSLVTIPDGADSMPLKSLTVGIEAVQSGSGDPSPTNIRPISGWTGCKVTRTGKNLIGGSAFLANTVAYIPSATVDEINKTVTFVSSASTVSSTNGFAGHFKFAENTAYTVILYGQNTYSSGSNSTNMRLYYTDNTYETLTFASSDSLSYCVLTTNPNKTIKYISKSQQWSSTILYYDQCGIFEGTLTADDFAPYEGATYDITFPSEAGTVYGGVLDVTNGTLTVTHKLEDGGDLTWTKVTGNNYRTFYASVSRDRVYSADVPTVWSSIYNSVSINRGASSSGDNYVYAWANSVKTIAVKDTSKASLTAAEFKDAMVGVQFMFQLVNPTTYTLDSTTIRTLLGLNNIWADTGAIEEVVYAADTKMYIENLTKPTEDDMVANAAIESGKFFMINNRLFLSTASIANGATITVGTNATELSLAEALNSLN